MEHGEEVTVRIRPITAEDDDDFSCSWQNTGQVPQINAPEAVPAIEGPARMPAIVGIPPENERDAQKIPREDAPPPPSILRPPLVM